MIVLINLGTEMESMFGNYVSEVVSCCSSVVQANIDDSIKLIDEISKQDNRIYIAGNGGSASIASHFAVDLVKSGYIRKMPIKAISLTDNSALLTATSNDFNFSKVFSWQLAELGSKGDLLFVISSSGNSTNIVEAISMAKSMGIKTISLTGFDGGEAAKISNLGIVTLSENGNYGPVEDSHSIICHYIARRLRNFN